MKVRHDGMGIVSLSFVYYHGSLGSYPQAGS